LSFSQAALEACLEEMNGKVEQLQAHRKALQAQIATMVVAHAADMDAMTQQLAVSAGNLAAKQASVRYACLMRHYCGNHVMHVLPDVSMGQACLLHGYTSKPQHLDKSRLHPSHQDKAVLFMSCLPTRPAWYVKCSNCAVYPLTYLVSRRCSPIHSVRRLRGCCRGDCPPVHRVDEQTRKAGHKMYDA